ncbi:tyrosine-type recombinase/integrase [[Mycoplasma] gypis]|uniref:Tyrosine-type recombinase/integrase n=1 Tax=[Mycoplasma] gypis TaxID=92404 RepID=A0ABZ2RU25_9BACT|nr:tyrosine-type recombinase/integrase [[Mycoplasma] gypis]MBN0919444.1 tyrosine-type recombinase/integrase [[Mycoplasma] gypis]
MIEEYLDYLHSVGRSSKTLELYKIVLTLFEVDKLPASQIAQNILDTKIQVNTKKVYKTIIKSYFKFFNKTKEAQLFERLSVGQVHRKLHTVINQHDILTITKLKENDKPNQRAIKILCLFLFETGIRISELSKLKQVGNNLFVVGGKGNKTRQIFYNLQTYELFKKVYKTKISKLKKPDDWIRYNIHKYIRPDISPHSLRRSFATHLIYNNAPISTVSWLMGHASSVTTLQYIHPTLEQNKNIYEDIMLKHK